MTSARDVIVNSLFEPGPDKLDGFSRDDRQVALKRTDAILAALDAAGFTVERQTDVMALHSRALRAEADAAALRQAAGGGE